MGTGGTQYTEMPATLAETQIPEYSPDEETQGERSSPELEKPQSLEKLNEYKDSCEKEIYERIDKLQH